MTRSRLLSHWPLIFAFTFAGLSIPLLWSLQSSQDGLRAAIDARIIGDTQRRAQGISDFVLDLKQTVVDLASSQEVGQYLTNRALGMSMRYGLQANIDQIGRQFDNRLSEKTLRSKQIIKSISYFDQNGALLVRAGLSRRPNGAASSFDPSVTISTTSTGSQVVAIAPVIFKNHFSGSIVVEIEPGVLSRLLLNPDELQSSDPKFQELLLSSDGTSIIANERAPYPRDLGLALLGTMPSGKIVSLDISDQLWSFRDLIGLRWDIDGTPISFVSLQSKEEAYGQVASPLFLYLFAFLSAIIFIAACTIEVILRRATILASEFSESNRHRSELKEHNRLLQDEVNRRQLAEIRLNEKTQELKRLNAELRISSAAFEAQDAMIIVQADKIVLRANEAFCALTGYASKEVLGFDLTDSGTCRLIVDLFPGMWEAVEASGSWQGEVVVESRAGDRYTRWLTVSSVKDSNDKVTHYIGTFFDCSERKKAEQRINELAFFDQLTGLPNRVLMLDRARQVIIENERSCNFGALLFIDLDNFKVLNDTLGHDVGDLQLKLVAERLTGCVRAEDTIARFGGDEFVVLLPRMGSSEEEAVLNAELVAEKIAVDLRKTYHLSGCEHLGSCSIGVTVFGQGERGIEEILKRADLAMYDAKSAGRDAIRFFDPKMQELVTRRATIEAELRDALCRNELAIYLQPQVDRCGKLIGAEALLRWYHPVRGLVMPSEFVSIAECSGLILPIGYFVLEAACRQLAEWSTMSGLCETCIAINVSAAQIHDEQFIETVMAIIDRTGADPNKLKFELTESILVRNIDEIVRKMKRLKQAGISFSLDDFGTGYSSLSYLKRLPLDQLKIDRGFVTDLLLNLNDAAIARMIVALGRSLELEVIAEGVETVQQRELLEQIGCFSYQGFLFGRPVPLDQFERDFGNLGREGLVMAPEHGSDGMQFVVDSSIGVVPRQQAAAGSDRAELSPRWTSALFVDPEMTDR
jgi:diguanylate cyclase (GGDEF)-like protein/PAS domain S-box-containing protein